MWMSESRYRGVNKPKPICPKCKETPLEEYHEDLPEWHCWKCEETFHEMDSSTTIEYTDEDGTQGKVTGPGFYDPETHIVHHVRTTAHDN